MIVFCDLRLIILTAPHTASRAIHHASRQRADAVWVNGPTPGISIDHHTVAIPAEFADYRLAATVRDPFDRAVGLWHHWVWWLSQQGLGAQSFADYAVRVQQQDDSIGWLHRVTLANWLAPVPRVPDHLIRFESIDSDLRALGLELVLPDFHTSRQETRRYYTAPATIAAVREWAREDFARFGYPPDIPVWTPDQALSRGSTP